jgi:hypothetical protein
MITYLFDKIRISLGDSQCPLYHRCPGADNDNNSCISHRGRNRINREGEED